MPEPGAAAVNEGARVGEAQLRERIAQEGFARLPSAPMRELLGGAEPLADWESFAASWNDLALDTQLPEGHRYRRRRHATLSARAGERAFRREPHQPHYQAPEYNRLVGGIERWFDPVRPEVVEGASFRAILGLCLRVFGALRPRSDWHIEVHQFRIEARPDAMGQPTPEGVHRDGVDYVLVLLVSRVNIESGTTTVHAPDGRLLGSFTLTEPLDAAWVDDARVMHGVTPVRPVDPGREAHRDVLVVTFRAR
ncbi:MAG TPA: 2OG-Fe dioxygenase family protein [Usitatibacter sp.]|nr:2OG-Fe dioxygenase family protein [Usitatibacter sp.]